MSEKVHRAGRGRPKNIRAGHVLEIAKKAYCQTDPADVSINAICGLASVSKPSLYREFGSEDGLTLSVLDHYSQDVLADINAILSSNRGMNETLDLLADFLTSDTRLEFGCLYHKMLAGKHRLGPRTLARLNELDSTVRQVFLNFLQKHRDSGDWRGSITVEDGARYLVAQFALVVNQRAEGKDVDHVSRVLCMALSIFGRQSA